MLNYSYIWSVADDDKSVTVTVSEQEGDGPSVPVAELALDLSVFDTQGKIEAEAALFTEQIKAKRETEALRVAEEAMIPSLASELRGATPNAPIQVGSNT